jgi:VanZ family protein
MKPFYYALLTIAWMSFIFFLSSLPSNLISPDIVALDVIKKVLHVVIFGILAVLYLVTLKGEKPLIETSLRIFLLSLFLAVTYAITDEYHQSFTPGRHPSVKDVVVDAFGALAFLGTTFFLKNIRAYKKD